MTLLEPGVGYQDWQTACRALNSVQFTEQDAEEGFELIRYHPIDFDGLERFTARFQDIAPELVIASLQARWNIVAEAQDCGVDLKASSPNIYAKMLIGPLTPEDFNIFPELADAHA